MNTTTPELTLALTRILRGNLLHRHRAKLPLPRLHQLLDEVEERARNTGFPLLTIPLLAEEMLRHAVESSPACPDMAELSACA